MIKNESVIRVSVSEAARLFGVSSKTIRQAIKEELLKYIIVKGRYKINFSSLIEWSRQSTRRSNQLDDQGIGQYIDKWKIHNKKYSPHIKLALNKKSNKKYGKSIAVQAVDNLQLIDNNGIIKILEKPGLHDRASWTSNNDVPYYIVKKCTN